MRFEIALHVGRRSFWLGRNDAGFYAGREHLKYVPRMFGLIAEVY